MEDVITIAATRSERITADAGRATSWTEMVGDASVRELVCACNRGVEVEICRRGRVSERERRLRTPLRQHRGRLPMRVPAGQAASLGRSTMRR